jgi:protein-disulfide isomerase
MEADYGEKLHIVFKHRPWLESHQWAKASALSAECAGKQGKFWPMYDLLFSKQAEWGRPRGNGNQPDQSKPLDVPKIFEGYAKSLGLDLKSYNQCVADPATFALIEADIKDAQDHFINSTPTFFVDGRRLVGGNQLKVLGTNAIERRLGR